MLWCLWVLLGAYHFIVENPLLVLKGLGSITATILVPMSIGISLKKGIEWVLSYE